MTPVPGSFDALHQQLFGFVPALDGAAYERISAVLLAFLGWTEVAQGARERRPGRRARQTIDVMARHPSGIERRLIVQCKDYDKKVGKEVLDTLVGIGAQIGDVDLGVVTTIGYTRGARDVAHDENVRMLVLRPYDPDSDDGKFVREVVVKIIPYMPPAVSRFNVETAQIEGSLSSGAYALDTVLQKDDGSDAETLAALMYADINTFQAGTFDRRVVPPEHRWVPSATGRALISALTWHEVIVAGAPTEVRTRGDGEPVLVVEQVEPDGAVLSARLVVDRQLFAWDLNDRRQVVPRGPLIKGEFVEPRTASPGSPLAVQSRPTLPIEPRSLSGSR
jgi:hypothetical protein